MSYFSLIIGVLYFFSLASVFFARFLNLRIGNVIAVVIAFIAFLGAALRPWDFPDVDTYELMFDHAATGAFDDPLYWVAHGEPGFKIFVYLLSFIGFNYAGFLIAMAGLSYILLLYISRISSIPFAYLWFTYFSYFFITRDLGVLRLSIASHLIIIFFLQRKVIWQSITILFTSLTFQFFALIAVFAKISSYFKISPFSILLLFLISFALSQFINFDAIKFLLPDEQVTNLSGAAVVQTSGGSIVVPIVRNTFFACLIYYFMRNEIRLRYYRVWIWAAIFSVSFYILASGILVVGQRFSAYFGVIIPVALAYIMHRQSIRNDNFLLIVLVCLLNFASLFYFNSWLWR